MTPQDQETIDLDETRAKIVQRKLQAFDYMKFIFRNGVANTGHATIGTALIYTIENAIKDIENLFKEHLKKYPD